jgi:diguanylate cyclase (GGDEF)-like protein
MPGGLDFHHPGDQQHVAFLEGADLLIHDAQYTEAEYPQKLGWGHSTVQYATDVALAAKARRLALFHHDPIRDDAAVEQLESVARQRAAAHDSGLEVFAAAEGLAIEVRGTKRAPEVAELSALSHRPTTGRRVLIVGGTEGEVGQIIQELEEDNLVLLRASTGSAALASADGLPPDLVILSTKLPDGHGFDLVSPLRNRWRRPNLPILLLTDEPGIEHGVVQQQAGATDYLAKPFSPPMLRSRVRAWLARVTPDAAAAPSLNGMELGSTDVGPWANQEPVDDEGTARARIAQAIQSIPAFAALTPEQVGMLAQGASIQVFEPGREIVREGSPSDLIFAVLSGSVRVIEFTDDPVQSELVLADLGQGEVFGEMGVVVGSPRSATVVAVQPARCLIVPGAEFLHQLQNSPSMTISFVKLLATRMQETNRRLARYSPDPLTGLPRRRSFYDQYPSLAAQARRRGDSVLLGLIDVVNLKGINDRYGYNVGDEVVRTVADALRDASRQSDLIARYGGDEFAVLLADGQTNALDLILERLRQRLDALAPSRGLPPIRCDVGVAIAREPPEGVDELFLRADQDIQRNKSSGGPAK